MPETAADDITAECIRAIAAAKALQPAQVLPASTLESLALDSLDKVSLSFDLEEKYGIEIPEHRMYALLTVADIAKEVETQIARKTAVASATESLPTSSTEPAA